MNNNIELPDVERLVKDSNAGRYPLYQHIENYDDGLAWTTPIDTSCDVNVSYCNKAEQGEIFVCSVVDWQNRILDAFICKNRHEVSCSENSVKLHINVYNKMYDKHYIVLHKFSDDIVEQMLKSIIGRKTATAKLIAQYNAVQGAHGKNDKIGIFNHYYDEKIEPQEYIDLLHQATSLKRNGDYKEAINIIRRAIETRRNAPGAYYNLGKIQCILGNYEESVDNYRLSVVYDTTNGAQRVQTTIHLGYALRMGGIYGNKINNADKLYYLMLIDPYNNKYYNSKISHTDAAKHRYDKISKECAEVGEKYLRDTNVIGMQLRHKGDKLVNVIRNGIDIKNAFFIYGDSDINNFLMNLIH